MKIEKIKELAAIFAANGLSALEYKEGGNEIRFERAVVGSVVAAQPVAVSTAPAAAAPEPAKAEEPKEPGPVNFNNLVEVKSPMVGVFYASSSPDSEPFVSIGSKVKRGDVLCIIESMKLMNEITAQQDGEIVDVCAKSGDIAEFDQVLFKMA